MKNRYILALDQGTTNCCSIIYDEEGIEKSIARFELTQYFPQPGWVEHDPEEIWKKQLKSARCALKQAGIRGSDVAALAITNQRETIVIWDRKTGNPVYNAIVWQDRRTNAEINLLKKRGFEKMIRDRTGLVLDPFFSGTKIQWILDHVDGVRARAEAGNLVFGTIDTWLLHKLTGGKIHATDMTNASRTHLFNIHSLNWDKELLSLFDIPETMLPELVPSSGFVTQTEEKLFNASIPISGIIGDQNAALVGQLCNRLGMVKNTYGTGCSILLNTGTKPVESRHGMLSTLAWQQIGQPALYASEGPIFIGGSAIQWLRDGLGIIKSFADVNTFAAKVSDSGGVYFVPAFVGLGAPYWNPFARGTILGLTRGTTKCHICRATLDTIAHRVADVLFSMQDDIGQAFQELRVDGGVARSNLLLQIQADILGVPVQRTKVMETTALGAAYLAGLAMGIWTSIEDIPNQRLIDRSFEPIVSSDEREDKRNKWKKVIQKVNDWNYNDNIKIF